MAYAYINLATMLTQLSERLDDESNVYWTTPELTAYIQEALRTWQSMAGYWRNRMIFNTALNTSFYDLTKQAGSQIPFTVTGSQLVSVMLYQLIEAQLTSAGVYQGTNMFTLDDITQALQRRRDQFLLETGMVLSQVSVPNPSPPESRVALPDNVINIRRCAWLSPGGTPFGVGAFGAGPFNGPYGVLTNLWRSSQFGAQAFKQNWALQPQDPPIEYSVATDPPVTVDMIPPPLNPGTLKLLAVLSGGTVGAGLSTGTFAHVQGNVGNSNNSASVSVQLPAVPKAGNLVCVAILADQGGPTAGVLISVKDANGNVYQVTPNSPSASSGAYTWMAYLLSAPTNASQSIIATFSLVTTTAQIYGEEFSISAGTQVFDTDATGTGTGTTVNTPAITPANAGELIYGACSPGGSIFNANAPWTPSAGGVGGGDLAGGAEYLLASAAGPNPLNFSQSFSIWASMAMAFYIISPGQNPIGVPDDLAWVVKWGAMADLLSKAGQAQDLPRADYCQKRWMQGIEVARIHTSAIYAALNGVDTPINALASLDSFNQNWQNGIAPPTAVALASWNMFAVAPPPDGIYSVRLDVIQNAPIPVALTDQVQIGREELDVVLDYCQHLAMFKMGGQEFLGTTPLFERMFRLAGVYNETLKADVEFLEPMADRAIREELLRPRRAAMPQPETAEA